MGWDSDTFDPESWEDGANYDPSSDEQDWRDTNDYDEDED